MIGYRIKLAPDDNGTVLVTCPAPPEVTILGEDEADALRRARLFRLDPASRLEQLEAAFAALGQAMSVSVRLPRPNFSLSST
jgi:hypothetical protein